MPPIAKLPVLILHPHSRCNCRCVMCDIWKTDAGVEISQSQLQSWLPDIERLGVEWVVFSGGEPLMHSNLFSLCAPLRERGIRITLLSTGLLLRRYAPDVARFTDDVIVSLDGPRQIHDAIRQVAGAFDALAAGVDALHWINVDYRVTARCTVQKRNHAALLETANTARQIGLQSISFLAADLRSTAFNRAAPWSIHRQSEVALDAVEIGVLESHIPGLAADPFVSEGEDKLRRIVSHFRAQIGMEQPVAPRCNAPWVSAVVEADGTVRPCFFHRAIGSARGAGLKDVLNGSDAMQFRASLDIGNNEVCARCVCSLHLNQRSGSTTDHTLAGLSA